MKIVDRLILALYSICIAALSLIIMVIPFNYAGIINIEYGVNLINGMNGNYIYSLLGLVFFIVSLRFLLSGIIGNRDSKQESFLVMKNDYGEIVIYAHTIVGLVENIVDGFSGIKKIDTRVDLSNGVIYLLMKGEIMPEINIPEISKELQIKVKEKLESTTGAQVGEIKVEINNVSAPSRTVKWKWGVAYDKANDD